MHEHVDAIVAGECGEAEIGDDEPLGRQRVVVVAHRAGGTRGHDIDARQRRTERLIDREGSRDVGVERLLDLHLALPDLGTAFLSQALEIIAIEIALEVMTQDGVEQVAITDSKDLDRDRRGVDAHHGNSALAGARQHIGFAGEAHERLAVAHVDVELGGFCECLLHERGKTHAQRDGVALAVLEAFDAELPIPH